MSERQLSVYASFSRRALARFIDLCVVLLPCGVFYLVNRALGFPLKYTKLFNWQWPESTTMFMSYDFPGVLAIFTGIKLLLAYPYFALMESSRRQGTPGKQLMRIRVTGLDGGRISFGRATGRYFLKAVSSFEFMLGYLISFSDQRQTWHDYMAKTLVVRSHVYFSPHYLMPKIPSRWMFDLPFSRRRKQYGATSSGYECIWCDYQSAEKRSQCPNCGGAGYAPVGAVRAMMLMAGVIFSLLGGLLAYVTFWVVSERLADDRLGREGTPWAIVFIIFAGCALCLSGGLSSILGKKWLMRLIIGIAAGRGGRSRPGTSRND